MLYVGSALTPCERKRRFNAEHAEIAEKTRCSSPRSRRSLRLDLLLALLVLIPTTAAAQYSSRRAGDVVQLEDTKSQTIVSIIPTVGNIAFEMKVKGQNVLFWPYASVEEFKTRPALSGIPFLGPWANRLDEQAFYANGRKYAFDMELGNVRGAIPIHGFLTTTSQWQVREVRSDGTSAWVTSRLEVFRQPMWMKQFPFAHAIEITHRLRDGVLEVSTRIENMSAEPMPLAIGFHPYFQLTDSTRDEWTIAVGARTQWLLAPNKVPTGETRPIEQFFHDPASVALKDYDLDHVFGDLVRDGSGRATMTVTGKRQKLDVLLGPKYRAVVIWAPQPSASAPTVVRNFICFEPMAAITDAMNLAQRGLYRELQSIPPGESWQESFWVRTRDF
jgi:aldose 1-epimerase